MVVGDLGSCRELLFITPMLIRWGYTLVWFADPQGKAKDYLTKEEVQFREELPSLEERPNLVLIGTSVSAWQFQVAMTERGHQWGSPVLWLEDLHGTGARLPVRCVNPDVMLVIDEVAETITHRTRPGVKTYVIGKPTFADLSPIQGSDIRSRIRNENGIGQRDILVSYWSGGEIPERAEQQLQALVTFANLHRDRVVLVPRLHPKLPSGFRDEMWQFVKTNAPRVFHASELPADHLHLASDVVTAEWTGTEGLRAMLLERPVLVWMFPMKGDEERLRSVYPNESPPLLEAGAALAIATQTDLDVIMKIAEDPGRALQALSDGRQDFLPLLMPGADRRAATVIEHNLRTFLTDV